MASDVGDRYARALLEVTEERKETDKAAEALNALVHARTHSKELAHVMLDPRMKDERMAVLTTLAEKVSAPAAIVSLLRTLDAAERLDDLQAISTAFVKLADQKAGRVRGHVTSAAELADAEKKKISESLTAAIGKKVAVDFAVDASLIGGVSVKIQDLVWDGSLKTQLERLRQSLRQ
ncbi:MAG: ATP synthase F1 subunit delta [Deltaproteobacteria bacterium]|nr:ATP synthase F1 subunit delta [Deltaproteobacteria bacterium]